MKASSFEIWDWEFVNQRLVYGIFCELTLIQKTFPYFCRIKINP